MATFARVNGGDGFVNVSAYDKASGYGEDYIRVHAVGGFSGHGGIATMTPSQVRELASALLAAADYLDPQPARDLDETQLVPSAPPPGRPNP